MPRQLSEVPRHQDWLVLHAPPVIRSAPPPRIACTTCPASYPKCPATKNSLYYMPRRSFLPPRQWRNMPRQLSEVLRQQEWLVLHAPPVIRSAPPTRIACTTCPAVHSSQYVNGETCPASYRKCSANKNSLYYMPRRSFIPIRQWGNMPRQLSEVPRH